MNLRGFLVRFSSCVSLPSWIEGAARTLDLFGQIPVASGPPCQESEDLETIGEDFQAVGEDVFSAMLTETERRGSRQLPLFD